jgi:hypothetical protein
MLVIKKTLEQSQFPSITFSRLGVANKSSIPCWLSRFKFAIKLYALRKNTDAR